MVDWQEKSLALCRVAQKQPLRPGSALRESLRINHWGRERKEAVLDGGESPTCRHNKALANPMGTPGVNITHQSWATSGQNTQAFISPSWPVKPFSRLLWPLRQTLKEQLEALCRQVGRKSSSAGHLGGASLCSASSAYLRWTHPCSVCSNYTREKNKNVERKDPLPFLSWKVLKVLNWFKGDL